MAIDTSLDKYLLEYITKLDNNTITIDELVKEFFEKIKNDYNINKTSELESQITNLLNKYVNKEISNSDLISSFKGIVSSNRGGSQHTYVPPKTTIVKPKDTTSKDETPKEDKKEEVKEEKPKEEPVPKEEKKEEVKTTEEKPKVETVPKEEKKEEKTVVPETKKVETPKIEPQKPVETPKEESIEKNTVDVDTSIVIDTSAELENVESIVSSATIEIPSGIASFASGITEIAENAKTEIMTDIEATKEAITETLNTVDNIDESIPIINISGISFGDLSKIAYDYKKNSKTMEVTAEFFRKGGCQVDGNIATLKVNGKEYKYDMKKRIFYVNGVPSLETYFYIPSGATDCSKLNTYTCFVENSSNYKNLMDQRSTNSVVIKIMKPGSSAPYTKYSETADVTKFINTVAKTDISSGNCRNVIGGDSVYGTHSLKIAAAYPDLYQTVYCVNNAVIVTGKNGIKGTKTQFANLEELKKLDGKDIYFISVTGDPNLNYGTGNGGGWVNKGTNYEQSYVYTGLNLVCQNCPNANIHMVYDERPASSVQGKLITLLKGLENTYSNYSYDASYWSKFANKEYLYHSQGNILVNDLAGAGVTNYNAYTG